MSADLSDLARSNLAIVDGLLAGWAQAHDRPDRSWIFGQRGERPHAARFASIYALAAHAHTLVEFVRPHLAAADVPCSVLQVRQAYECSLTATWMALNSESAFALYNEETRRHRSVKLSLGKSRQFADRAELLEDLEPLSHVSSLPQARRFDLLCEDLEPDGGTLYLLYRILSKYCHAGAGVIDQYLTPTDADGESGDAGSGDVGIRALHPAPLRPGLDEGLTTWVAATSLILAGRAVDFIDPARDRRRELRTAARELGLPTELRLSAAAHQRIEEAAKARRRASRRRRTS